MNPLKIVKSGGLYSNGVQVTSNADLDYSVKTILTNFATESGSGDYVGDLNIDSLGTSVGTFEDNYATAAINTHPYAGSVSTDTYTFKQNVATASESSLIRPGAFSGNVTNFQIRDQSDSEINDVISLCLNDIAKANSTAAGTGSYYVGISAPTISGTWVAQDLFYDEVTNAVSDDSLKTTYKLWRKTSYDNSPTEILPLKVVRSNPVFGLREMSTADIQSLTSRLRNRIVATGIGKYVFQTSAPGTGTWVARGSATDRNPQIQNIQYTGTYAGTYGRQFERQFTRQFSAQYERGQFARQYVTQYARIYSGQYAVNFARAYLRSFERGVVGTQYTGNVQYQRVYTGQYEGQFERGQYSRIVVGPDYNGLLYSRIIDAGTYAGTQYTRQTPSTQYSPVYYGSYDGPQYAQQFTRIYSGQYSVQYTRSQYTRIYTAQYTRIYSAQYGVQYTRIYSAAYGRVYSAAYGRVYSAQYGRTYSTQYASQFAREYLFGPYYRQFQREFERNVGPFDFNREFPSLKDVFYGPAYSVFTYFGPPTKEQPVEPDNEQYYRGTFYRLNYNIQYSGNLKYAGILYTGPGYNRGFLRGDQYSVNYARLVVGPQYSRATAGPNYTRATPGPNYTRITPGPQYTVNYGRSTPGPTYARATEGPGYDAQYARQFSRIITGPQYTRDQFTRQFGRVVTGPQYTRTVPGPQYNQNFTLIYSGTYQRQFTRIYSQQYTGIYTRQFSRIINGPQYAPQFTRNFVGNYSVEFLRGEQFARQFTRIVTGPQYDGQFTRAQYAGQYGRLVVGTNYSDGQYTTNYDGSRDNQYTGATVTSNYTSTTKTLWLRVA